MKHKIFGVAGNNWGVGKDTFIQLCIKNLKGMSSVYHLADEVKREAARKYNLDYDRYMNDNDYKNENRGYLIEIGDGYRRENPTVWVRKVVDLIKKTSIGKSEPQYFFIGDIRHTDEPEYLSTLDGFEFIPVFIHVNPCVMKTRLKSSDNYNRWLETLHSSSQRHVNPSTYDWKYIIGNNNSMGYLEYSAINVLREELMELKEY